MASTVNAKTNTIQSRKTQTRMTQSRKAPKVQPSVVNPDTSAPFTLDQELEPFGKWVGESIWVPPKDSSEKLADSMLRRFGALSSKATCWSALEEEHRSEFTHVREIELSKASIRLPQAKLYVSITERERFDEIEDTIPGCVQTRLEEFLAGPGREPGVKVYYLKPLCVEVGDELFFTSKKDLMAAIQKIQDEVFEAYRLMYLLRRPKYVALNAVDAGLGVPRKIMQYFEQKRQKAIDAYQARLEFKRRKTALRAAGAHRKFRTDGCTYEEMLALTNPLDRVDVIEQYSIERKLKTATRDRLIRTAMYGMPWFVSLSIGISFLPSIALALAPPVVVCDPAFVAEMPQARGTLFKIGHFDEVGGVTHVEI